MLYTLTNFFPKCDIYYTQACRNCDLKIRKMSFVDRLHPVDPHFTKAE